MKKAVLSRFMIVILLALILSSFISYYYMAKRLLEENILYMNHIIKALDHALDYGEDLEQEVQAFYDAVDDAIRITVIDTQGRVWADTDIEGIRELENHLEREEIREALQGGSGYSTRYSDTLHKNMLYVAGPSQKADYIIRVAVTYDGMREYVKTIFPAVSLGVAVAFAIALIMGLRFTNTVIRPLYEISAQMEKVHTEELDFHFRNYRYEELNVISRAMMKLAEEVRNHIRQIENEKKIRQEFFSNASHELKTPITAIRGYTELLDNGFVQDEETRSNFIQRILKTTHQMTTLIDDILMISRLEARDAEVTFSQVRMQPLVEEIFEALEPIAAQYQVALWQDCEPLAIEASARQLRELLMNLVSNGIKYNHPGGNVWVSIHRKAEWLLIEVKDDGTGISEKDQPRVFERFYRVDKGRSKKMGGTGLGLSIVKHIVEFYEGDIQLKSEPGKGSSFNIRIPMERDTVSS